MITSNLPSSALRTRTAMAQRLIRFAPVAAAALLLALPGLAAAQSLVPPPGPIGPTPPVVQSSIDIESLAGDANHKHLITQPGSYHFSQNITGVTGKNGIGIAAGCVTLDLGGYHLIGVAGTQDGVANFGPNLRGIVVRNGCIRGWTAQGIDLGNTATFCGAIDDIRAINNGGTGIMTGQGYIVTNCVAAGNGPVTGFGGGIALSFGSSAIGCVASFNLGDGIFSNIGGTIQDCTAYQNNGNGIQVTTGCKVVGNNCRENGFGAGSGAGILAGNGNGNGRNRIESNNCSGADFGIRVTSTRNIIIKNTCTDNTTNWDFLAGNFYGPIVNLTASAPLAVNGNAAATSLANPEPNANFSH